MSTDDNDFQKRIEEAYRKFVRNVIIATIGFCIATGSVLLLPEGIIQSALITIGIFCMISPIISNFIN